jgi:hypothetical protein
MLEAGTGVVTITPPLGTPLAGSFSRRPAATVDYDLTARALLLANGGMTLALVVCDLIWIEADLSGRVRAMIEERTGIPGDQVMISGTHTHTGPLVSETLGDYPDPAYIDWVMVRIADAVSLAHGRMTPARIAAGAADVEGVCFNRRYHMRDGTVVFNPGIENPEIIAPAGPTDPEVTALLVEDLEGTPIALWASLSLHYVGTDNELGISPDYYGAFARVVQRVLGPQCVGLLTNGTSGDINNIDVSSGRLLTTGAKRAELVATTVAAAAIQATMVQRRDDNPTLDSTRSMVDIERCRITDEDLALAEEILAQPETTAFAPVGGFSFVTGQPIPGYQARDYASGAQLLATMPKTRQTEVQIARIGDFAIVALPGEIFVEFGLSIKSASPFTRTAVISMANDHIGYCPTRQAFREGSYETWRLPSSWSAPGAGERLVETALAGLNAVAAAGAAPVARGSTHVRERSA